MCPDVFHILSKVDYYGKVTKLFKNFRNLAVEKLKLTMRITYIFKALLAGVLLLPFAVQAKDSKIDKYHEDILEMTLDENLESPEVPKKYFDAAHESMKALATKLRNAGFKTDLSERGGLVLMITIPVSELFMANDTDLSSVAEKQLKPLVQYMRTPDQYKLLIAVHSDDTGSEEYLNSLTRSRADAICQWIGAKGIPTASIVTYGMGFDEPKTMDQSRQARAENRRVEFYFVPGPVMIEQLKAGRR